MRRKSNVLAVRMFAAQLLSEPAAAGARTGHWSDSAKRAFTQHWPEYMIEGLCLGMFMISACTFGATLEHPASPLRMSIANTDLLTAWTTLGCGHEFGNSQFGAAAFLLDRFPYTPGNSALYYSKGEGLFLCYQNDGRPTCGN